MNVSGATGMQKLLATAVSAFLLLAIGIPLGATLGPSPELAFLLSGNYVACTALYWRPVPGQPGRAYFLSAGHCWQERYVKPTGARVVWAKVPGDRSTFMDILVGETGDVRSTIAYPQEFTETPKVGDVHVMLAMRVRSMTPRFEPRRLTFKTNLGDAYVYEADDCVAPGYSGAPVLTEDGRLVGIVILGDSKFCKRLYVVPLSVLYGFRPDLRP